MSEPEASAALRAVLAGDDGGRDALLRGDHTDPHRLLGPHRAEVDGTAGVVVRVLHPDAVAVEVVHGGKALAMTSVAPGLFARWLPGVAEDGDGDGGGDDGATGPLLDYRLHLRFADGTSERRDDPYRFLPTLGDLDLYLASEGNHLRLWECLGARPVEHAGVPGFAFSVWAPNARRVSVVGDFCSWDGRLFPMRRLGSSGIFELFLPGFEAGAIYKYEIVGADGRRRLKADPLARFAEKPPATASRTFRSSFEWRDDEWMERCNRRDVTREPMAIYEVHLGSWRRTIDEGGDGDGGEDATEAGFEDLAGEERRLSPRGPERPLSYRELAPELVAHVRELGFNYVELMPVCEHPYDGSWGYQVTGYYAPTARYGDPDDFRHFVDCCHRHGIGVILDWVPAHFVKDAHGLGRFDGTALYEHEDPRLGVHPDWDTYVFNYGRHEVRNFLVANALYWFDRFHVDGLRVDAVASMLYLDYSREEGEWIPNPHGGNENLEAIELLRAVNQAVAERYPGRFVVAEESTAWPKITHPASEGGLGFTFKWNMGWMHDTLAYFAADPLFRSGCHDQLTFAMIYEHSERFVNPLSHDEVVHGKGSLYTKMPGDPWRKLANLRALFAYQLTRPGKKLLFMGSELAPVREWSHETALDWYLLEDPGRHGLFRWLCDLGALYRDHPCLWRSDPDPESFEWLACHDRERSVVSYLRRTVSAGDRLTDRLMVVLNLTPVPRAEYRIGVPEPALYRRLLSSDDERYGGSGYPAPEEVATEPVPADGCRFSVCLTLPPLAALVLRPEPPRRRPPRPPAPPRASGARRRSGG